MMGPCAPTRRSSTSTWTPSSPPSSSVTSRPCAASRSWSAASAAAVVATASCEARQFGVRSAMSTAEARSRCPHAAFLTGRFDAYRDSSRKVMALLRELSPLVEPRIARRGLRRPRGERDRGPVGGQGDRGRRAAEGRCARSQRPVRLGRRRHARLVAKIASDLDKPDGLVVVPPGTERELLRPMKVTVIPGVGPATAERLQEGGGAPSRTSRRCRSRSWCGWSARPTARRCSTSPAPRTTACRGRAEAKSISVEDTYDTDLVDRRLLDGLLDRQATKVAERLGKARLSGRTVTVKGAAARLHHAHPFGDPGGSHRHRPRGRPGGPRAARRGRHLSRCPVARRRRLGAGGLDPGGPLRGVRRHAGAGAPPRRRGLERFTRGRRWAPGMDVTHTEHGQGWVWGSGARRVTVRFETAETGPVRCGRSGPTTPSWRRSRAADRGRRAQPTTNLTSSPGRSAHAARSSRGARLPRPGSRPWWGGRRGTPAAARRRHLDRPSTTPSVATSPSSRGRASPSRRRATLLERTVAVQGARATATSTSGPRRSACGHRARAAPPVPPCAVRGGRRPRTGGPAPDPPAAPHRP